MEIDVEGNKAKFIATLKATNRKGVDAVIAELERLEFFTAPASSVHHLAVAGGLCRHSLNVYNQAILIRDAEIAVKPEIETVVTDESIAIAALLHDFCKANVYKVDFKNKKNAMGAWEKVPYFKPEYKDCPMGHGEKSMYRLLKLGLETTEAEDLAIRWHMGRWCMSDDRETLGSFSEACVQNPLVPIIIAADELATRISEAE